MFLYPCTRTCMFEELKASLYTQQCGKKIKLKNPALFQVRVWCLPGTLAASCEGPASTQQSSSTGIRTSKYVSSSEHVTSPLLTAVTLLEKFLDKVKNIILIPCLIAMSTSNSDVNRLYRDVNRVYRDVNRLYRDAVVFGLYV